MTFVWFLILFYKKAEVFGSVFVLQNFFGLVFALTVV